MGGRQCFVGAKVYDARFIHKTTVFLRIGPGSAGIAFDKCQRRWLAKFQSYCGTRFINRERPAIARHVPVELVVILKETQHPIRAVSIDVRVDTLFKKVVFVAEINSYVASTADGLEVFWHVVAAHGERLYRDLVIVTQPVLVLHRKVTIDAATNLFTFGAHLNGLSYLDHAVRKHMDVAVETQDPFVCQRRGSDE